MAPRPRLPTHRFATCPGGHLKGATASVPRAPIALWWTQRTPTAVAAAPPSSRGAHTPIPPTGNWFSANISLNGMGAFLTGRAMTGHGEKQKRRGKTNHTAHGCPPGYHFRGWIQSHLSRCFPCDPHTIPLAPQTGIAWHFGRIAHVFKNSPSTRTCKMAAQHPTSSRLCDESCFSGTGKEQGTPGCTRGCGSGRRGTCGPT